MHNKIIGVARMAENDRALLVIFETVPSDDDLRALHDGGDGLFDRPTNCRSRLAAEGKAHPKSGCDHCGTGGMTGCPYEPMGLDGRPA